MEQSLKVDFDLFVDDDVISTHTHTHTHTSERQCVLETNNNKRGRKGPSLKEGNIVLLYLRNFKVVRFFNIPNSVGIVPII